MNTIEQGSIKRLKMLKNIHITIHRITIKRSHLKTNLFTYVFFKRSAFTLGLYGTLCVLGRTFRLNRSSVVILSLVILNKLILQESKLKVSERNSEWKKINQNRKTEETNHLICWVKFRTETNYSSVTSDILPLLLGTITNDNATRLLR